MIKLLNIQPDGNEPTTGSYFVSAYPPFSAWSSDELGHYREELDRPEQDRDKAWGIYVHIPFCVDRCHFCYYLSHDRKPEEMNRTVDAIVREAGMVAEMATFKGRRPNFVYFGGGTPSLLAVSQLERLFMGLRASFDWVDSSEVSFECAPKSVTERKSALLRKSGVTRISLGVQQMNDEVLQANGRVHLIDDVVRATEHIRKVGFDVLNMDLIAGLVGETDRSFDESLERVIDLAPDSVTTYLLEVPTNTPLFRSLQEEKPSTAPASWTIKRERLRRAMARLEEVGYTVRSAYTASRTSAAQRFIYQDEQYHGADLLGLGVSSFGYVGGVHQQNLVSLRSYLDAVEGGVLPLGRAHRLTAAERGVREFILQLKLGEVDLVAFVARHGNDILEHFRVPLAAAEQTGWLRVSPKAVTLTREGLLRVDRMLPEFYPKRD